MSRSQSWQLGPAKVTAAFARGPAHFRSCLAKLCSTWWLVRSHKSSTSCASVRTHTLPGNGGRRGDGVTLTTPEINSRLVHQLSCWLVVPDPGHKSRCCTATHKEKNWKDRFWWKRCVSVLQVTIYHFTIGKKPFSHLWIVLTLWYSFASVLPWWRHWECSPFTSLDKLVYPSVSLRATGTCNCIAHSLSLSTIHTTQLIYLLWNTSVLCYSSFFLSHHCRQWNTGSLQPNAGQPHFEPLVYLLTLQPKKEGPINSWPPRPRTGQHFIYIFSKHPAWKTPNLLQFKKWVNVLTSY